ncbi:unnamed protein product [Choristocarpus tenellus]
MGGGKRQKGHDRDKYYHLAKDQGFRARSAFKLIEINKKYGFLKDAKVCIDLCAAPGGWCQVAAKHMPRGSIILGVDLLPIRAIPNVKTLVHDITTEECRTALKREMQSWKADVVLCDGAPNVGTAYKKDAYEQNEIALAALKVATQQLRKGGTFVTKAGLKKDVYRSQDYNSLMWVIQQFFGEHQAVKPASSRSKSAEIFVVGTNYKAPDFIDPRMLDPRHAFTQDFDDGNKKGLSIFHKKYNQHNKRQRQGYDDDLGMSLTRTTKVSSFVDSEDPVRVLTDTHVLEFGPECQVYKEHRSTTEELINLCSDLRVLGKGDFRNLIKWRLKLVKYRDELRAAAEEEVEVEGEEEGEQSEDEAPKTEEEKEEDVQAEIKGLQLKALAEKKRLRKKEREGAARLRSRVAMGMENRATDLPQEEGIFSLKTIQSLDELDAVREVELSHVDADEVEVGEESTEEESEVESEHDRYDEEDAALQEDLDAAYLRYLEVKENHRTEGTGHAKRTKKYKAMKAAEEEMQDTMLYDGDQQRYLEILAGVGADGSDASSDISGDEDDFDVLDSDEEDVPVGADLSNDGSKSSKMRTLQVKSKKAGDNGKQQHPLLAEIAPKSERQRAAAERWFSDTLFDGVDESVEVTDDVGKDELFNDNGVDDMDESPPLAKCARVSTTARGLRHGVEVKNGGDDDLEGSAAADLLASMPKTDKEKRKEKRRKALERKERREIRHGKRLSEDGKGQEDMQVVSGNDDLENLGPKERAKVEKKRNLIRAGMGLTAGDGDTKGFEVAKASEAAAAMLGGRSRPKFAVEGLDVADEREYGSDVEDYDDDDKARQLALGTMMLRKHRAKELVDAAYNRFSWNDDADLPDWFTDDEHKHYRPQVPLPPALVEQMKNKFMSLASKPIKKVAEARLRKRKRAADRLRSAQKKATSLAANPDISEREKLKAVRQAMKKGISRDQASKVYVVSKSGGKSVASGAKKSSAARVKMVDARMKSDTRGMKRAEKKKAGKATNKKKKGKGRQGRH